MKKYLLSLALALCVVVPTANATNIRVLTVVSNEAQAACGCVPSTLAANAIAGVMTALDFGGGTSSVTVVNAGLVTDISDASMYNLGADSAPTGRTDQYVNYGAPRTSKVAKARNKFSADVVMIITGSTTGAARLIAPTVGINAIANVGYSRMNNVTYGYQHEFGHLLNGRHARDSIYHPDDGSNDNIPGTTGHGYYVRVPDHYENVLDHFRPFCARDIMAYTATYLALSGCTTEVPLGVYSNYGVSSLALPLWNPPPAYLASLYYPYAGTPGDDATAAIVAYAPTVAAFHYISWWEPAPPGFVIPFFNITLFGN